MATYILKNQYSFILPLQDTYESDKNGFAVGYETVGCVIRTIVRVIQASSKHLYDCIDANDNSTRNLLMEIDSLNIFDSRTDKTLRDEAKLDEETCNRRYEFNVIYNRFPAIVMYNLLLTVERDIAVRLLLSEAVQFLVYLNKGAMTFNSDAPILNQYSGLRTIDPFDWDFFDLNA